METLSDSSPLLGLARRLQDPLVVVDVGARWGFSSIWDELGDRCVHIGFEPDATECERLVELHRGRGNMRFVPHALGAEPGMGTLYLTRDRGGCSVLHPSEGATRRHPGLRGGEIESTSIIEMTTLDDWCAGAGIASVDAVKIDTQGSELAILRGAETILGTVRAIEVEVEFNELYDDVPLFGEIDRFLRGRGFVLWKLRDLAHYAQHDVPAHWRNVEAAHYDTGEAGAGSLPWHMATFAGGPGQLFWANAFYLRTDAAYPTAGLGWERLVRDALITRAHNFADLSTKALNLAMETAPPAVRDAAALALASESERFRAQLAAAPAATLSQTLKLSPSDPNVTGGGWQPVEVLDPAGPRWTGPGRDTWVDVPFALPAGTRVEILSPGAAGPAVLEGLVLELNRVAIALTRSPHEQGLLLSGVTPAGYASERRYTRTMLRVPATIPRNEVDPGSDDDSEIGLAVSWLRFTPPA